MCDAVQRDAVRRDAAWLPTALVKTSTSLGPRDLETVRNQCAVHTVHEESRRRGDRDGGGSQVKAEALDEGHASRSVSHARRGVPHPDGACLLVYGAQVWSSEAVVDGEGEGHAGPCRGTGSGEGQMLGLD